MTVASLIEAGAGLSADLAIAFSVVTGFFAVVATICGIVMCRNGSSVHSRMMMMLIAAFNAGFCYVAYQKYEELLAKSNGFETGPVYFWFFVMVVASMPMALALSVFFMPAKSNN